jgi:hypothetical protein
MEGPDKNADEQSINNSAARSNERQRSHSDSTVYSVETSISPFQVTIGYATKPDRDGITCFVVRSDVFVGMSTVGCMQRWILFQILSNAQDSFSVGTKEMRASMRVSLRHSSQAVARLGLWAL